MLDDLLGSLFAGTGGDAAGDLVQSRRARRLMRSGRLECAFRVISGDHDGLTDSWRDGVALLSVDRIAFTSYIGSVRFLRRKPVLIHVEKSYRPDESPAMRLTNPHSSIRLETRTAELMWVLPREQAKWAIERLRSN